jgi:hypothetical protein
MLTGRRAAKAADVQVRDTWTQGPGHPGSEFSYRSRMRLRDTLSSSSVGSGEGERTLRVPRSSVSVQELCAHDHDLRRMSIPVVSCCMPVASSGARPRLVSRGVVRRPCLSIDHAHRRLPGELRKPPAGASLVESPLRRRPPRTAPPNVPFAVPPNPRALPGGPSVGLIHGGGRVAGRAARSEGSRCCQQLQPTHGRTDRCVRATGLHRCTAAGKWEHVRKELAAELFHKAPYARHPPPDSLREDSICSPRRAALVPVLDTLTCPGAGRRCVTAGSWGQLCQGRLWESSNTKLPAHSTLCQAVCMRTGSAWKPTPHSVTAVLPCVRALSVHGGEACTHLHGEHLNGDQ